MDLDKANIHIYIGRFQTETINSHHEMPIFKLHTSLSIIFMILPNLTCPEFLPKTNWAPLF